MNHSDMIQMFKIATIMIVIFCLVSIIPMTVFTLYLDRNKKQLLKSGKKIVTDLEGVETFSIGGNRHGGSNARYVIISRGRDEYKDLLFKSAHITSKPAWYVAETKKIGFGNYQELYQNPQKFRDTINEALRKNKELTFDVYLDPNNKDNYYVDIRNYKKRDAKIFAFGFLAVGLVFLVVVAIILTYLGHLS